MPAEITVDLSRRSMLEDFLGYLEERSLDPSHAADGNAIADFVEKFMIVEISRLSAADETSPVTVLVPDKVLGGLTKPLPVDPGLPAERTPEEQERLRTQRLSRQRPTSSRNGNGHLVLKKRCLTSREKDEIRSRFVDADGKIAEDVCVTWKDEFNAASGLEPITSFQVAGFVSYLHDQVGKGNIKINDRIGYQAFLDSHRALYPKKYPHLARKRA